MLIFVLGVYKNTNKKTNNFSQLWFKAGSCFQSKLMKGKSLLTRLRSFLPRWQLIYELSNFWYQRTSYFPYYVNSKGGKVTFFAIACLNFYRSDTRLEWLLNNDNFYSSASTQDHSYNILSMPPGAPGECTCQSVCTVTFRPCRLWTKNGPVRVGRGAFAEPRHEFGFRKQLKCSVAHSEMMCWCFCYPWTART